MLVAPAPAPLTRPRRALRPALRAPRPAQVSARTVAPLLAGAAQLALHGAVGALAELLRARLCPASALATAALAAAHGPRALAAAAEACAAASFPDVLREDPSGFAALPAERLASLLASDALAVPAESDALRALLAWAATDAPQRCCELPRLLPLLRLRLLPRAALLQAAQEPVCAAAPAAAALLRRVAAADAAGGAQSWRAWPSECRCGDDDDDGDDGGAESNTECACCCACAAAAAAAARWAAPRAGTPMRLLAAGGHDGAWRAHRSCEWYDIRTGAWAPAPPLLAPVAFLAAARAGSGALLAVAGGTFAACACRAAVLPPASADDDADDVAPPVVAPWAPAAPPRTPRVHAALAAAPGGAVYLLGGRAGTNAELDVVERYDADADAWTPQPALRMRAPRASLGAAALGDCLWAVGGQAGRATFASVDVLDVPTGRWLAAPPLRTARKYGAVVPLRGCVLALGGMSEARQRLACCERLDPREGRWRALPPMALPRSSAAAAAAAGALYVAGGNDGEATHAGCARYDAAADRWEDAAPLGTARSGAALVAL